MSFVVFRKLLEEVGVLDMLVGDARSKVDSSRKNDAERGVIEAAISLRARLDNLNIEVPNRLRRLRDIRDRFLAHNLDELQPVEPPIYENLRTLTDIVLLLAEDATRVLQPTIIEWPKGQVSYHTHRLIAVVAEKFPAQ